MAYEERLKQLEEAKIELTKEDLLEIGGLLQSEIIDDYSKDARQKRIAQKMLNKIRAVRRSL